jgi:hypothetical protein
MDQRERADKIELTLAAEPIENAEASDRSSLGADREARQAGNRIGGLGAALRRCVV